MFLVRSQIVTDAETASGVPEKLVMTGIQLIQMAVLTFVSKTQAGLAIQAITLAQILPLLRLKITLQPQSAIIVEIKSGSLERNAITTTRMDVQVHVPSYLGILVILGKVQLNQAPIQSIPLLLDLLSISIQV